MLKFIIQKDDIFSLKKKKNQFCIQQHQGFDRTW